MKSCSHLVLPAALAGLILFSPSVLNAQTTTAPIVVKQTTPKPTKPVWLKAEVVHADRNSMIVREQSNEVRIHTFTYADQLKPKMERFAEQNGFQSGDKVKILYQPGQTVALKVRGKPSKPL
jgi:hypothetical protein